MFVRLNYYLKTVDSRRVKLTSHVYDELKLWRRFVE